MFLRQAVSLLSRVRFPSRTLANLRQSTISSSIPLSCNTEFHYECGSRFSTWRKYRGDLALWIILSGQAESVSVEEFGIRNDSGEASVTGLRRIEDGSVISNEHTSKWRIFTDNGRDLFLKGKLDEAERFFVSALQEAKEGFGERDPHVASSCNNLAELYRVRKVFEKAEPLYLEAINILEESYNPEDIRVGAAFHNLGQFYLVQRKLEQARKCYERALKIKGRVLGHGHPDYANTMYHLGTVLNLQGKEKDAEALIQDSIRILEEGGLGESLTCIRRMRYLCQILLNSNRLPEAENLQRKILHVLELSKGWDSLDTVIAAEGLALTLQSVGNLREAQDLLERCLDVRKTILGEDHIQVAANMLHLARVEMFSSNRLRKFDISKANAELDKAKLLLDNSIRIARLVLDSPKENISNLQNGVEARHTEKDGHAALLILLQSLDELGLLEITKHELQELKEPDATPIEAEHALRQCISIFKEPGIRRSVLNSAEVKAEYLSCLKHLVSLLSGTTSKEVHQSRPTLQELKDEIRLLEAELTPNRKRRN
ncbi:tetratricopeptide repeat (TPR)-like superfamily protein isoform X2 [Tasmannia lanceolata]|uniref:tetratricopeptide repeat (TPR)-like superfamily protein isoform X2 n=1 Tax=Tasmannia lanceolata TaxID=3420 RepID=UPI004063799A